MGKGNEDSVLKTIRRNYSTFWSFCYQLLSMEKRLKDEIDGQKGRIETLEKELEKHKGALADEEAVRRLKMAEETIEQLQKNLAATKQVTAAQPTLLLSSIVICKTVSFTR